MYTLIVDCNGFTLGHKSIIVDPNNQIIEAKQLDADDILDYIFGNKFKICDIKLSGPIQYCLGLKDKLYEKMTTEYSENKITIEVI